MKASAFNLLFRARLGLACCLVDALIGQVIAAEQPPLGPVGSRATYVFQTEKAPRGSTVSRLVVSLGPIETRAAGAFQWLELDASKAAGKRFRVWLLANAYPQRSLRLAATNLARYVLQEGDAQPKEFVHRVTGEPVLPTTGAWEFLWPRPEPGEFRKGIAAPHILWLGHTYKLASSDRSTNIWSPPAPRRIELLPDVLVGVPSNTRTRDDRRRYDGSDYELVRLTREDYAQMIRAGMNWA